MAHISIFKNISLSFIFPRILNIYTQNSCIKINDVFTSESPITLIHKITTEQEITFFFLLSGYFLLVEVTFI